MFLRTAGSRIPEYTVPRSLSVQQWGNLHGSYCSQNVIAVIRLRSGGWADHVARM
jgi:hypothetical protein